MKLTTHVSRIKTIREGHKDFKIQDGMVSAPRAGFEISPRCPEEYKSVILHCIETGWLKPVAHVLDEELMWDTLKG